MYCKSCGKEVDHLNEGACPHCGGRVLSESAAGENGQRNTAENYQPYYNQMPNQPQKINQTPYLIFAILATVFCCIPLGIPAIVFAAKIGSQQAAGDYAGAEESAKKAKMFTIIGAALGALVIIAYFVLVFMGIVSGVGQSYNYY